MGESNNSGGIGFLGALTLIFVIAKITGYVDWDWWIVFSPVLLGILLIIVILIVCFIVAVVQTVFDK